MHIKVSRQLVPFFHYNEHRSASCSETALCKIDILGRLKGMLILSNGNFEIAPIVFAGGDGSSFEKAIVILGATDPSGVDAEYAYLTNRFPRFQLQCQRLQPRNQKNY